MPSAAATQASCVGFSGASIIFPLVFNSGTARHTHELEELLEELLEPDELDELLEEEELELLRVESDDDERLELLLDELLELDDELLEELLDDEDELEEELRDDEELLGLSSGGTHSFLKSSLGNSPSFTRSFSNAQRSKKRIAIMNNHPGNEPGLAFE
jgi:hypothetical protein